MIDNQEQAMQLMRKMEAHLPIAARPTGGYVRALREQGVRVKPGQALQIESVLYTGDGGGISCAITPSPSPEEAIVTSLTQLRVSNKHPLAAEIRAYQQERIQRLAQSGGTGRVSGITLQRKGK